MSLERVRCDCLVSWEEERVGGRLVSFGVLRDLFILLLFLICVRYSRVFMVLIEIFFVIETLGEIWFCF